MSEGVRQPRLRARECRELTCSRGLHDMLGCFMHDLGTLLAADGISSVCLCAKDVCGCVYAPTAAQAVLPGNISNT
jgi:hypothetical protein